MQQSNKTTFKKMALAAAIASLVGCGGGGGGDDTSANDTSANTNLTNNAARTLAGSIQKGPFVAGSSINVYELDDNLKQTGVSHRTNTTDAKGSYALSADVNSKYVEVFASGYYYDETTGKDSSAPYELSAIVNVDEVHTANLNLLTSLAKDRIRAIVAEGKSFSEANKQAKKEVLGVFNLQDLDVELHDLDILKPTDAGGVLLAVSSTLMQMAHSSSSGSVNAGDNDGEGGTSSGSVDAALSTLMANIKTDLVDNGTIDADALKSRIKNASIQIDIESIKSSLQKKFELSSAPKMEKFLDNDGDGVIGENALKKLGTVVSASADTVTSASGVMTGGTVPGIAEAISNDNKKAIILGLSTGFQIYDISKPESPTNIGSYLEGTYQKAILSEDGNTLFALGNSNGLSIFDISNPNPPTLVGSIKPDIGLISSAVDTSNFINISLSKDNTKVYLLSNGYQAKDGIHIIDVSNHASPVVIGNYPIKWPGTFALSDDNKTVFILYRNTSSYDYATNKIVTIEGKISALDITDPKNINLKASYLGNFQSIEVSPSNIFVDSIDISSGLVKYKTTALKYSNNSFNEVGTFTGVGSAQFINSDFYAIDSSLNTNNSSKLKQYSFDEKDGFILKATHSVNNGSFVISNDGKLILSNGMSSIDLYGF